MMSNTLTYYLTTHYLQQGETALHVACRYGQTSTAQFLTTLHISVDAQDQNLETALHIAAWNGHARIAQVLLKAGANKLIKNEVRLRLTFLST